MEDTLKKVICHNKALSQANILCPVSLVLMLLALRLYATECVPSVHIRKSQKDGIISPIWHERPS